MAIDVFEEEVLTLAEAAKVLPRRRRGRKVHTATLYRWASSGIRGVKLETVQVGGTRCTSKEALQRFFDELHCQPTSPGRRREKSIKAAELLLRTAGI